MNSIAHQVASGIIHQAVALYGAESCKAGGHDQDGKMPPFAGAGMASVLVAVIADFQHDRLELAEGLAQWFDDMGECAHAGSTFLNGLTVTLA
jgi:hypothetical protein